MNGITLARYEYKYPIAPEWIEPIREYLRPYCVMDEHGDPARGGFYTILSLYFDDDRYRLYWETEDNVPVRAKLRVRTYGDADFRIVKFEVKRRVHDLVVKSSAVLPYERWADWVCGSRPGLSMDPGTREALDSFRVSAQMFSARPKVLVRYERQAFRSVIDDYVRLSFDRRMCHQTMRTCSLEGWPDCWASMDDAGSMGETSSRVLMELKFRNGAPPWLLDMVRRFGLVRRGYSKYASAVRRGVMDGGGHWDMVPVLSAPSGRMLWTS